MSEIIVKREVLIFIHQIYLALKNIYHIWKNTSTSIFNDSTVQYLKRNLHQKRILFVYSHIVVTLSQNSLEIGFLPYYEVTSAVFKMRSSYFTTYSQITVNSIGII